MKPLECYLCGQTNVNALFTELRAARAYTSYYCRRCDLYQTLGAIDPVSPDYIDLEAKDLDAAHRFIQNAHKLPAFRQWQSLTRGILGKSIGNSVVLDIGCGVGGFLDYAKRCGATTFGFDAAAAHTVVARTEHPNVRQATSIKAYFDSLGVSAQIDLVTMWDVLEHIREPDSLLGEIRDLLRSNDGLLYISVPSGAVNPAKVRLAKALHREIGLIPWEHVFYYTTKSLRAVLEKAGLKVVALGGVEPYVRQPVTLHESIRRVAHHALKHTPYAFQLYALARTA